MGWKKYRVHVTVPFVCYSFIVLSTRRLRTPLFQIHTLVSINVCFTWCYWYWGNYTPISTPSEQQFINSQQFYQNIVLIKVSCVNSVVQNTLTHLPLDQMVAISQTAFSNTFSWMNSFVVWLIFRWSLFLRVQSTITQHWRRIGTKPLSEPMLTRFTGAHMRH